MKPEELNKTQQTQDVDRFPGVSVDIADDDKTTECLEKQETRILNNNPRNNDM